jgi:hypothetical protein
MKVFLGWSGGRSKQTAEALGDWLGQVIQAVDPWISSDILKGARWEEEISDKLEEAKIGIICLTKENLDENWILFEAGALSKTRDAHVCTFLLDLKPTDIKQPLALFQHTKFEKEDIRKLAHTINQAVEKADERSLEAERLNKIFDRFWPDLEEKLKEIAAMPSEVSGPSRSQREILEEILGIVRTIERGQSKIEPMSLRYLDIKMLDKLSQKLDEIETNSLLLLGEEETNELAGLRNDVKRLRNG